MTDEISNDNTDDVSHRAADPHGQAAILLVESLIHGLIARDVITVVDAVEIIDVAATVKADIGGDLGDPPASVKRSLAILDTIGASLRHDLPRD